MTQELTTVMTARARQLRDEAPWIWLYEFQVDTTPPQRIRVTNYGESVTFGTSSTGEPIVYDSAPLVHGDISETLGGDQPRFQVQVGNAGLELAQLLDQHAGFAGQRATVRLVNSLALGDTASQLRFDGIVLGVKVRADRIAVDIGLGNLDGQKSAREVYSRFHCRWVYGDGRCGARLDNATLAAAFPKCSRTLGFCEKIGAKEAEIGLPVIHPFRFGGAPSIARVSQR